MKKMCCVIGIVILCVGLFGCGVKSDKSALITSLDYHTRNVTYLEEHSKTDKPTILPKHFQDDIDKYKLVVNSAKNILDSKKSTQEKIDKILVDLEKAEIVLNKAPTFDNGTSLTASTTSITSDTPIIGMTSNEVLNTTWGSPKTRNKTVNTYGTSEQWVYSNNKYVYLEDGIVTAIQSN